MPRAANGQPLFQGFPSSLPVLSGGFGAWADMDNDGQLDLVLAGVVSGNQSQAAIWRNLGSGVFTNIYAGLTNWGSGSAAWGDFNNDGLLDLIITGADSFQYANCDLWQNLGGGTFANTRAILSPSTTLGQAVWGDFDNDGRSDILIATHYAYLYGGELDIWQNGGVAGFTKVGFPDSQDAFGSAAWGDFDNDGYLDFMVAGADPVVFQLWRNLGNGTFTNIPTAVTPVWRGSVAWGDFDNDGLLDILVSGSSLKVTGLPNDPVCEVWRNLGNGTFTNIQAGLPGVYDSTALWADFDNDGRLDILIRGTTAQQGPITQVWRNQGDGTFSNLNLSLPAASQAKAAAGDFDNDGRLDLLLNGVDPPLWRNQTPVANTPPTAPTGLSSETRGTTGVVLRWNAASDLETPAKGLNYNIRVGTTRGGADIVSPLSDPGTGFRRVPQFGNAGERGFSILTNLAAGTYYWSVQAVDTGFMGGPFAAEAAFSVGLPGPPTITHFAHQSGQFQVQFPALAGFSYTLQSSTNLTQWMNVTNVTPSFGGIMQLLDTNATDTPAAYYRLRVP